MNSAEESVLNTARAVLSQEELETLVRLLRLRHSPRAVVRIAANMALIPLLSKLSAKIKGVC